MKSVLIDRYRDHSVLNSEEDEENIMILDSNSEKNKKDVGEVKERRKIEKEKFP